jgi:hypothetical protein
MSAGDELLRRALRYPYEMPERSFVLVGGRAVDPATVQVDASSDREPLLAYGANSSPAALAAKLGSAAEPLPAERAVLPGHDIAYSAHVSLYGAVPATLVPSAGTEVDVFVLRVTAAQRRALDTSEPNYERGEANGIPAYLSRHGALRLDGSPVALAAIAARGRGLPAMSEAEVLERVRALLAPRLSLEQFVAEAAADPAQARRWTEQLRPSRSDAG